MVSALDRAGMAVEHVKRPDRTRGRIVGDRSDAVFDDVMGDGFQVRAHNQRKTVRLEHLNELSQRRIDFMRVEVFQNMGGPHGVK